MKWLAVIFFAYILFAFSIQDSTEPAFEKDWKGFEVQGWTINFYRDSTSLKFLDVPIEGWMVFADQKNKHLSKHFTICKLADLDSNFNTRYIRDYLMAQNCPGLVISFDFKGYFYKISSCESNCPDSLENDCLLLAQELEKHTGQIIYFNPTIYIKDSIK